MLPRVWIVFTQQHLQADQNVWCRGIHSNSADFSTELTGSQVPKQQYDIRLLFKIKHFVLTPAHKSQKRETQALLLILQSEQVLLLFLWHIRITAVVSDHVMGMSWEHCGLVTPAVDHTALWLTNSGQRSCTGGVMQWTRIQLKFGVKHWCFLQLGRIESGFTFSP